MVFVGNYLLFEVDYLWLEEEGWLDGLVDDLFAEVL